MKAESFPPIAQRDARVLILGSMPGVRSLEMQQYYAHQQNGFWYIMTSLLGAKDCDAYDERTALLQQHKIAVWDVLKYCVRVGSLDSAIEKDSMVVNDFAGFFAVHPDICHVFFNGKKAEKEYRRHVLPFLPEVCQDIQYKGLPSTSPAMASLSKEDKLKIWSCVIQT